jgi:hypothetical protein
MMHEVLARAVLAHTMAQNIWEILALIGPFAIVFGAGAVLIIGPLVRHGGDRYKHHPIRGDEKPQHTNGSTKPSRAAASSDHSEGQVAASSGTAPGEDVQKTP